MSKSKAALQQWATQNKLNPAALAKATGYSYQHAWRLLNGDTEPTTETLGTLAVAFGAANIKDLVPAFRTETRQVSA